MDPLYGQRTTYPKKESLDSDWVLIDANEQVLGRLASQIAFVLQGKNKPNYQPGVPVGDRVVVINAAKVKISGNKIDQKVYHHHTGYIGGLKTVSMRSKMDEKPEDVIKAAVKGMLPKNNFSRKLMTRIRVFADEKHELEAQNPQPLKA